MTTSAGPCDSPAVRKRSIRRQFYRTFCNAPAAFARDRAGLFLAQPHAIVIASSFHVAADDVRGVVAAAARHGVGWRVIEVRPPAAALADAIAQALHDLGFVVIAGEELARGPACQQKGRHIALMALSISDRRAAVPWVRALARDSPRGHVLVINAAAAGSANPAARARELADSPPGAIVRAPFVDVRSARAERYTRRRRMAAAMRWTAASLAAAERRGDDPAVVAAAARSIELLLEAGDVGRARQTAQRLGDVVTDVVAAADASALRARTLLADLELDAAEAALNGARAESILCGRPLPDSVACALAELCVWRGRFEEGVSISRFARAVTPQQVAAQSLAAWAAGDRDLIWTCRSRIDGAVARGDDGAHFWSLAIAALTSTLADRRRDADSSAPLLEGAPKGYAALALAVAIEAGLRVGEAHTASRSVGRSLPLHALLLDWMQARHLEDAEAEERAAARARHLGVDGLARWGRKDSSMQMIQDWPALLHIVHEADDELSALTCGCAWLRRQGRAGAVAIVDAEATSWLASDGWTRDDLAHPDVQHALHASGAVCTLGADVFVSPSIRYSGQRIGRVIARGAIENRCTIEQAATALAAVAAPAVRARLDALAIARAAHVLAPEIIGQSPGVHALRDAIARAAGTVFPVLIEGESGTGKELVARALHRLGPRRDRRFCAVNCAAFTDELFEAELFGYARGAFTGAVGARAGLFEEAHEGTLFLDEAGDLSARAQAKLLRTLQEREVRRLGENGARRVDVRVVAATNVALGDAVQQGRFREDLLFRLAVIRIRVPPLRDRTEDIPLLAHAFWRRLSAEAGKHVRLGPDALAALCRHQWPGNIRELQNVLTALIVLAPARGRVGERHLSQVLSLQPVATESEHLSLDDGRRLFERRMIVAALARHGGRQAPAAVDLGLTRQGLAKAMRRLDLNPSRDVAGVA
jgi:DNA-binding NtrC family response regulator